MTTSGISAFSATRNDIIRQAALQINAIGQNVTMSGTMLQDFSFMLNALVKHYQSTGLHIWTETEGTLFLQPGQIRYAVGQGASDHCTRSYTTSTVSVATPISSTVIPVVDGTQFTTGYQVGIILAGGSIQWTTVAAHTTNSVTLAVPLTDAVSAGNSLFCYQSNIELPIKVVQYRRYNIASQNQITIIPSSRLDYNSLQRRNDPGVPNQVFFDRQQATGYFNVWQVPVTTSELVNFTWWRPIQDFTTAADNPDLPQEWIMTLIFNLAVAMSPQYPVAPNKLKVVIGLAEKCLGDVTGNDRETESVMFYPAMR